MSHRTQRIARLSAAIEQEMRALSLWGEQAPSAQALASREPFCYDTMPFDDWLQWVFLPRVDRLLSEGGALPGKCDIAPLAEVWFAQRGIGPLAGDLLELIREMDGALSDG